MKAFPVSMIAFPADCKSSFVVETVVNVAAPHKPNIDVVTNGINLKDAKRAMKPSTV